MIPQSNYDAPDSGAEYALAGLESADSLLTPLWSSLALNNLLYLGRYLGVFFSLATTTLLGTLVTLGFSFILSSVYIYLRYKQKTLPHLSSSPEWWMSHLLQKHRLARINDDQLGTLLENIIKTRFSSKYRIAYAYGEHGEIISFEILPLQISYSTPSQEINRSEKIRKRLLTLLNLYIMGYWIEWVLLTLITTQWPALALSSTSFFVTIELMSSPLIAFGIPLLLPVLYVGALLYQHCFNHKPVCPPQIENDKIELLKCAAIELPVEMEHSTSHTHDLFNLDRIVENHKETNPKINFVLGFVEGFSVAAFSFWILSTFLAYVTKTATVVLGLGLTSTVMALAFSILIGVAFAWKAYQSAHIKKDIWNGYVPPPSTTDQKILDTFKLKQKIESEQKNSTYKISVLLNEVDRLKSDIGSRTALPPSGLCEYDALIERPPTHTTSFSSVFIPTLVSAITMTAFSLEFAGEFFPLLIFGLDGGLVTLGCTVIFSLIYTLLYNYQYQKNLEIEYSDTLLADLDIRKRDLILQKERLYELRDTTPQPPPLYAPFETTTNKERENEHLVYASGFGHR